MADSTALCRRVRCAASRSCGQVRFTGMSLAKVTAARAPAARPSVFARLHRPCRRPEMGRPIDEAGVQALFTEARTHSRWLDRPVSDDTLRELYELLKWAPTSANAAPARFAFLRTREAKERLRPALAPLNVEKVMTAPVTVIVAFDVKFYDQLTKLFPHNLGMGK